MVQHNFGQRDTYNISFVLQRTLYSGAARVLGNCELATSASDYVFPLSSRARWNYTAIKQEIAEPGLYNLYFSNCEEETTVSFRVEWIDYNVDGDGRPIFLSAGESNLPTLFVFFCLCFVVAFGFWANECRTHRYG